MTSKKLKMSWPKDNLYTDGYVHQVQNFRYHWHSDDFELNILLYGKQHFFQGTDVFDLEENDVVLVNPNVGHASYCDPEGTIALVLHFSSLALKQFMQKGKTLKFADCLSDSSDRDDQKYRMIRLYTAQILWFLNRGDQYSLYAAKASLELLISVLCMYFAARPADERQQTDEQTQKLIQTVFDFLEEHYPDKITLEDIASLTGYNRTYISTLFHKTTGIRFYDYLMRLRLQKAIKELITTDKTLTDIALDNGFTDLKSFNSRFREMLKVLPSEYRGIISKSTINSNYYEIKTIPLTDPLIEAKLKEYMQI